MGRVMQIDLCVLRSSIPADPSVCFSLIPGKDFRVEPVAQVQSLFLTIQPHIQSTIKPDATTGVIITVDV